MLGSAVALAVQAAGLPLDSSPAPLQAPELPSHNFTFIESVKSAITKKDMVFFVGADKTGTVTLKQLYKEMPHEWSPCHDICHGKKWFEQSEKENEAFFKDHANRAFMDNGDSANFKWLAETFVSAR